MTPTSVRPAAVMCTRSLDENPVHESDDPEDEYGGTAATPLSLLFLLRDRRLRPRLGHRLCGRCGRGRGRGLRWRRRHRLHRFDHPGPTALGYARGVVGGLEHDRYVAEPYRRSRGERRLPLDALPIDERPVGGIEIHQYPYAFAPL